MNNDLKTQKKQKARLATRLYAERGLPDPNILTLIIGFSV
jgi:hypothetical protein